MPNFTSEQWRNYLDQMNEIKVTGRILPISVATKARNPHLFGGGQLEGPKQTKPAAALVKNVEARQVSEVRVEVWVIGFRKRPLDDDNFGAGHKSLQDAIAESIGLDDGDPRIKFHYHQIPTKGKEQTVVRIEAQL